MKKPLIVGLVLMALAVTLALAANPHFIFVRASIQDDGDLNIAFKEAGLGDNQLIDYLGEADAEVSCVCVTNGGQCPNADNKQVSVVHVAEPATFSSGQNGQVNQVLVLSAPDCPANVPPTCGNGQTLVLAEVTWNTIQLTDLTTPVGPQPASPAGGFSATLFTCP